MQVIRFSDLEDLTAYADAWDTLSGEVPFRSWDWLSTWWRHYGDHRQGSSAPGLFVLCVFDHNDALVGVAPWYRECSATHGRVLRFLGTGEVCSDYLSVLCRPGIEDEVTGALADWLSGDPGGGDRPPAVSDGDRWDLLELTGVDAEDLAVNRLTEQLAARQHTVHRRSGSNCWRIELPASWDEFLARLSKDHRKRIRRLERRLLSSDRAVLHSVRRREDLAGGMDVLVDLHQRRRRSLGEPGCFASLRFEAFHRQVAGRLLGNGRLHLDWLELDGRPVAVDYSLAGGGVIYAYQGGVEPEALDDHPGALMNVATIKRAIEQGFRGFDFLRGDEQYKVHWRAVPRSSLEIRIVPQHVSAQFRHGIWIAGTSMKQWIKGSFGRAEV